MSKPVLFSPNALDLSHSAARRTPKRLSREGRAWVRYPYHAEISFQALEQRKDGTWRPARVRDISTKGLGLSLDVQVRSGAILCVKLEGPAQRLSQPLLVRVVRAGEQSAGCWHLGCTFAIPLDDQVLLALLPAEDPVQISVENEPQPTARKQGNPPAASHDPFSHGSSQERRIHPRRRIAVPVILASIPVFGESPVEREAVAIDASGGGMKLLGRDCLGRGTILRLRSAKAPPSASIEVRVKVCSPQQTKWFVGVQFLQPPASEFMLFFR